jgi:Domain of unknown function (DUF1848)
MHLISASRRTDIPAFYADWFLRRIRAGRVTWANPYSGRPITVSLDPREVAAIVFWTRNFAPMMPHLPELDRRGYRYLVHITLTRLPRIYETHVPSPKSVIAQIRRLADAMGPQRVLWRYDPILITRETGCDFHLRNFELLAAALEGATRQCSISFVQPYGKVRRSFARRGLAIPDPDPELRRSLAARLGEIGAERGIRVRACCDDSLVGPGVEKGRCVDGEGIRRLWKSPEIAAPPAPTREECGCSRSWDVGAYDTCPHGCLYCYANRDRETAAARRRDHDPRSETLVRSPAHSPDR